LLATSPSTAYRRFPLAMVASRSGMACIRPQDPQAGQSNGARGRLKYFRSGIGSRTIRLSGARRNRHEHPKATLGILWLDVREESPARAKSCASAIRLREEYRRFCGTEIRGQAPRGDEELGHVSWARTADAQGRHWFELAEASTGLAGKKSISSPARDPNAHEEDHARAGGCRVSCGQRVKFQTFSARECRGMRFAMHVNERSTRPGDADRIVGELGKFSCERTA
jgi:hypothetical protein